MPPPKRNANTAGLEGLRGPEGPPSSRGGPLSASSVSNASLKGSTPGNHAMQSSLSSGLYISASTNDASSLPPAPTRFLDAPEGRVFTPEQARIFRAVQREDPSDPDQIEAFIKGSMDFKLATLMKAVLKTQRDLAELRNEKKATKQDVELRTLIRPIIRERLTLERYKHSRWNDPQLVLTSLRSHLPSDLVIPSNAAAIVAKVRIEEKAKLKDRLNKCRDLINAPLANFTECLRTELDSSRKNVEAGVSLWEAAACWRYVLLAMSNTRDENFWLAVDKILAQVDANWDFYTEDIVKYGYAVLGDHSSIDPNIPWNTAASA